MAVLYVSRGKAIMFYGCTLLGHPTHCRRTWVFHRFFVFLCCQLPSELTKLKRNSTKTCDMLGSECDFKMHVRNLGYILPYKSRGKTPFLRWLRNFNGNYTLEMKHDIAQLIRFHLQVQKSPDQVLSPVCSTTKFPFLTCLLYTSPSPRD